MAQASSMLDRLNRNPIAKLESFITAEVTRILDPRTIFWFGVSIAFAVAFGGRALQQAFSSPYVLQDDWRHHVFWMARMADPDLFPHDLIADYFQSVAPAGYATLYRAAAAMGLHPFLFARLLPMALGLTATAFCFAVSMQMLRVPAAGFIASLLLNQSLWMRNGLVSATPRAFVAPLLLAFMYSYLCRSIPLSVVTMGLMGLFFPSTMFIAPGVAFLRLFRWERGRPRLSRGRPDYLFCAANVAAAVLVLLPYAFSSSAFGPVVSASEGRLMPEFLPGGRLVVFRQDSWGYWISGSHTGMFTSAVFSPFTMCLGLLLPIILLFPSRFPLVSRLSNGMGLLPRMIVASLGIFFAANLLLFRLYLPSRFTTNSFRILLAVAAGISIVLILDAVLRWGKPWLAWAAIGLLVVALASPFVTGTVVDTRYKTGEAKSLYEYLESQPKDIVIASLADEANNLPIFGKRSVLVSRETALPFHKGYYSQIRERVADMIYAQYSPDLSDLQRFIQKYRVNYLLVDRNAFEPDYVAGDRWIKQYQPSAKEAEALLKEGKTPALSRLIDRCSVIGTEGMVLISAECVVKATPSGNF